MQWIQHGIELSFGHGTECQCKMRRSHESQDRTLDPPGRKRPFAKATQVGNFHLTLFKTSRGRKFINGIRYSVSEDSIVRRNIVEFFTHVCYELVAFVRISMLAL